METQFTVNSPDAVAIAGEANGDGAAVVLLHGLTATRRYVVMGSSALVRAGHRVVAYDARGHGASAPTRSAGAYSYSDLVGDLTAVLDCCGIQKAVLAGASMGAHTALQMALTNPSRVAGLVIITPAYDPQTFAEPDRLAQWDALADGLVQGGIDGFVKAYDFDRVPSAWREVTERVVRQRLARHENLDAVADALRAVPRSQPFAQIQELEAITAPTVVVASRDDADPGHPYAIAGAYAEAIVGATIISEEEGKSPLAWQGGQLSAVIAGLATRVVDSR